MRSSLYTVSSRFEERKISESGCNVLKGEVRTINHVTETYAKEEVA